MPIFFILFIQYEGDLLNFVLNKSFPNNLIITAKGVIKTKYTRNIIIGATILPNNVPNFSQRLCKGVNSFEFSKPSMRKIIPIDKDQILISFELNMGQIPYRKKTTKNNIPKLLFELIDFFFILFFSKCS